ncbi:MAG: hypothetical protein QG650_1050, partial [Patescibacteria group bacterium]|nr:hypothetical protein [Patescibacteria group bacterium]
RNSVYFREALRFRTTFRMEKTDFLAIRRSALSALVFCVTIMAVSAGYAAFTSLSIVDTGDALSKNAWNIMVSNLDDLNSKTTAANNGSAKAWVNFDGTSCSPNCMIRASHNVASVVRNNAGDYTVNFTTAMPDANYAVVANSGDATNANFWGPVMYPRDLQTGSVKIWCAFDSGTKYDPSAASVVVFR